MAWTITFYPERWIGSGITLCPHPHSGWFFVSNALRSRLPKGVNRIPGLWYSPTSVRFPQRIFCSRLPIGACHPTRYSRQSAISAGRLCFFLQGSSSFRKTFSRLQSKLFPSAASEAYNRQPASWRPTRAPFTCSLSHPADQWGDCRLAMGVRTNPGWERAYIFYT